MKKVKPILLIEDDRVDVMTIKRAMKEAKLTSRLDVAGNGEEALKYLREVKNEQPYLIISDINMPKMNGIEFLKILKQDGALKKIPVMILTTSKEEQDRVESFNLSVAGYMVKPVDYHQFVELVKIMDNYWALSELPPD